MRKFETLLALALLIGAGIAVYAASRLSLWQEYTVGPGAAPIAYGIGVMACAAAVALRPSGAAPDLGPYFPRAVVLMALMAALAFGIDYVGVTAGLFIFSAAGLLAIARMTFVKAIPLAAIWTALLYGVFVHLLNIPFPRGSII